MNEHNKLINKIEEVPQAGESSGKTPLIDGENIFNFNGEKQEINCRLIDSKDLSLIEILNSEIIKQSSIPYYQEVYQDVVAGEEDWGVTRKVKEYADYLKRHPESIVTLPPIQILDGSLHDGAHRLSTIYLLSKLHPEAKWDSIKLRVDFYQSQS